MESPERDRVKSNPSQNNKYQAARDTETHFTKREYQQRQKLLNSMNLCWVEAVLNKKLYTDLPNIEPDLEERLNLVDLPSSMACETPEHFQQNRSSDTKLIDVFDQLGAGKKLLIVGEPGSAKTTALLKLARILIDRIEGGEDINQPIPVVLNLSAWAKERQPFAQWIVQELSTSPYEFEEEVIETWLKNKKLLLLLDGLDEVRRADYRQLCIQCLYDFIEQYRQTEMVICCRIQVYEDIKLHLGKYLSFDSAIELKPLSRQKINYYVDSAGSNFAAVRSLLQADDTLYELVNTPLMLSVMMWTFKEKLQVTLPRMNSLEDRRRYLFNRYIQRMLYRRRPDAQRNSEQPYPTQKALNWLIWLAKTMQQEEQQIFLLERMQPNLLQPGCQKCMYRLGVILLSTFSGWLIFFIPALMIKLQSDTLIQGLSIGGLIGIGRVIYEKIEPVETLELSWRNIISNILRDRVIYHLKVIIIILTFSVITSGLISPIILQPIKFSFIELISVLIITYFILIFFLLLIAIIPFIGSGLKGSNIPDCKRKIPNLGIWQSIKNTFYFSLIGIIVYSLILIPICSLLSINWGISSISNGIATALMCGLIVGLYPGLICIQHLMLRLVLCFVSESIPLDFVSFLDYAEERIFLQRVGGGYKFIHNLLRDHFAQIESEEFIKWMEANKHQISD